MESHRGVVKVTDRAPIRASTEASCRLVGLGVWFSLRVREVPGSNPGRAQTLNDIRGVKVGVMN